MTNALRRPSWWGGSAHIGYTIVVFIILASLDNAAITLIPGMFKPLERGLGTSEAALGVIVGTQILVAAVAAVFWGYAGDAGSRKPLLFWGTVIWAAGALLSVTATTYWQFFGWQMIVAIGLGAIASVGFSVVSDFVGPRRRGLAMSFWGLSQGIGGWIGLLLASQLGADDFRTPLVVTAVLGFLFAVLYLFTFDAPRGFREPELARLYATGGGYEYRIDRSQLPALARRRTNIWLVLEGLAAQVAYGSLVWVPLLLQEKVIAQGYSESTGTRAGGLFAAIILAGSLSSILTGHIGDKVQQRTPRGRTIVSTVGILGAIPFFLIFFWVPLRGLDVTDGAGTITLLGEIALSLVTNPWVALAFGSALLALVFTSADSPNWFALISDVNLPEHRGTVYGLGNLANGVSRSLGVALAPALANSLERSFPPPVNWAISLSLFQAFFLPAGWCYWRASKTCPGDIQDVHGVLQNRAAAGIAAED
jgi:MFS family permease